MTPAAQPRRRSASPGRFGRRVALASAVASVALLGAIVHVPLRHAEYVQDDHLAVEKNPIVQRGDLGEILSTSYWAGAQGEDKSLYRPLAILSFAVERAWTGGRPDARVSHAVNLFMHLAVSALLLGLAVRLGAGIGAATAAALLFAVHPVHVEPIANVVGRAELGAALFTLGAILAQLAAGAGRRHGAAWGAGALVLLALGWKETAIAAPALVVLTELLAHPRGDRALGRWALRRAGALVPTALAVLGYLALRVLALETWLAVQQPHPMDNPLILLDGPARLLTALGLAGRAVLLFAFPVRLSIDYSGPVIPPDTGLPEARTWLGIAVLAGAAVLVGRAALGALRARSGPPPGDHARSVALGAALFLLPYLVTGNLLVPVGTIFAERLLYLPSAGFCLLAGLGLSVLAWRYPAFPGWSAGQRARWIGVALVTLLGAFSLLTWQRAWDWRDDETIFRAAARTRPNSPRAHFMLAKAHQDRGEDDDALALLERTLELWPEHNPALFDVAAIHARRGDLARAEALFRKVLERTPEWAEARLNLALTLHRQGRRAEAETAVRRVLAREPGSAKAWAELGHLSFERGRFAEAVDAYRRAVALGRVDLGPRLDEARRRAGSAAAAALAP